MKTKIILTALLTMLMFALVACQTDAPTPSDEVLEQGIQCQANPCEPDVDPAPPKPTRCPTKITIFTSDEVALDKFMTTEAQLCPDGTLRARTSLQSTTWFGFEGNVLVQYLASDGTVLGSSPTQTFWADGSLFGSYSNDKWTDTVSASILSKVSSLKVVHSLPFYECLWCIGI